ncbi:unnamed protein product [Parascedosporium putredinis]|uniref:Uncharacterized protein n=1 Tax=Parascedosporium putredinis TaxID=1442378 RepID=A0A9P1HCV4_9PEZI|nr:unnamed protein product [Parascedosporium putredinis]CAI8004814.1 unnamed protein product [Parascedosporium putredinis]
MDSPNEEGTQKVGQGQLGIPVTTLPSLFISLANRTWGWSVTIDTAPATVPVAVLKFSLIWSVTVLFVASLVAWQTRFAVASSRKVFEIAQENFNEDSGLVRGLGDLWRGGDVGWWGFGNSGALLVGYGRAERSGGGHANEGGKASKAKRELHGDDC